MWPAQWATSPDEIGNGIGNEPEGTEGMEGRAGRIGTGGLESGGEEQGEAGARKRGEERRGERGERKIERQNRDFSPGAKRVKGRKGV